MSNIACRSADITHHVITHQWHWPGWWPGPPPPGSCSSRHQPAAAPAETTRKWSRPSRSKVYTNSGGYPPPPTAKYFGGICIFKEQCQCHIILSHFQNYLNISSLKPNSVDTWRRFAPSCSLLPSSFSMIQFQLLICQRSIFHDSQFQRLIWNLAIT